MDHERTNFLPCSPQVTVGQRLFDITVEGTVVRENFDVIATAAAKETSLALPVLGVAVTDGKLDLLFSNPAETEIPPPIVSAIRIASESLN